MILYVNKRISRLRPFTNPKKSSQSCNTCNGVSRWKVDRMCGSRETGLRHKGIVAAI